MSEPLGPSDEPGDTRSRLLEHYRATRAALLAAIDGLTVAQLAEPSLDGWSVSDHLAHIAFWDELRTGEVERISAGYAPAWRLDDANDIALNAVAHHARRGLSPRQALWEVETSRARLLDAIARATQPGLDASRYGEAGLWSTHEEQHAGWIRRWRARHGI
jgi:hypothetical protein